MRSFRRVAILVVIAALGLGACASAATDGPGRADSPAPAAPEILVGELDPDVDHAIDLLIDRVEYEGPADIVDRIVASGDARVAWYLTDVLRFARDPNLADELISAFETVTGFEPDPANPWTSGVDQLLIWDVPAPPGYFDKKERLFAIVDERWLPLFDPEADIDWRQVSWGGVRMDDRRLGDVNNCILGCIPALDDPPVTDAAGGSWYPDDAFVFGVEINGEARAYPKNIMEVHEMVNDTLGGRRIGMPYCTLCGSAQAYLTDEVLDADGEPMVLRTSGLLIRSNKMMYDLASGSYFDTFLGSATTGPLRDQGVQLNQVSVITSTWGEWKLAHPETTIVAEDGGRFRTYPLDPLRGRDDDGPIFPIGTVDDRLAVQEPVLGVVSSDGTPVAFPVAAALEALRAGDSVTFDDVEVVLEADGLRAIRNGDPALDAQGHQAFWFAWSQFHRDTVIWE